MSAQITNGGHEEQSELQDDARSSSLSELEQSADEPEDLESREQTPEIASDYDTEAETERLERTPHRLNVLKQQQGERTPSKLAQQLILEETSDGLDEAEELPETIETTIGPPHAAAADEDAMRHDDDSPSRKRKRSKSVDSSPSDTDEPLAKRSHSARFRAVPAIPTTEITSEALADNLPERETEQQDGEDVVVAEGEPETAVAEPAATVKGRKGKKGKRKGKKILPDADADTLLEQADTPREDQEPAEEEEEDSNRDEEVAKKQQAILAFQRIEKEFAAFRERHINQQLTIISQELDLLKQPSNSHAEFQAQLRCVDAYRDEKIRFEETLRKFKRRALQVKMTAEREQLHSQYFQETRDLREKSLEACYKNLYALQKDRRRWGADETNYAHLYNANKAKEIARQTSYNLEVSILSGAAKHVGFPSAPALQTLGADDIESDFKIMKIQQHPIQPRISLRDAEREAVEKGFFEQNAWANPSLAHAMMQTQSFTTPNRIISNGSTIDINMGSGPHSQYPTPQNTGAPESTPGETYKSSKLAPHADSSPLGGGSAGPLPSVLSATTFPASTRHSSETKNNAALPPAAMSISVGGGPR